MYLANLSRVAWTPKNINEINLGLTRFPKTRMVKLH
uniref:Uncharacterized protein n=1 Tax=Arundo donax TaxID=35708 RepID=A0A0A9BKI9_ARUDO